MVQKMGKSPPMKYKRANDGQKPEDIEENIQSTNS